MSRKERRGWGRLRSRCAPSALHPPPPPRAHAQEFLAIQSQSPRKIGFFGTRNMGFLHQQLIEVLSYAMVRTVRGGAGGRSLRARGQRVEHCVLAGST